MAVSYPRRMLLSQVQYTFHGGTRRTWTLRVSLLRFVSGTELCVKIGLITIAKGGEPEQCPLSNVQQSSFLLFPGSDMLATKT